MGDVEQLASMRFDTGLPVTMDGAAGRTRNLSAHGIYLETAVQRRVGTLVDLTVEFTAHGRKQRLRCEGKVVRVEPRGERIGIAARLVAPLFGPGETVRLG